MQRKQKQNPDYIATRLIMRPLPKLCEHSTECHLSTTSTTQHQQRLKGRYLLLVAKSSITGLQVLKPINANTRAKIELVSLEL